MVANRGGRRDGYAWFLYRGRGSRVLLRFSRPETPHLAARAPRAGPGPRHDRGDDRAPRPPAGAGPRHPRSARATRFTPPRRRRSETLAARALQLDAALDAYGPEAEPGRAGLRKGIRHSYEAIWGGPTAELREMSVKSVVSQDRRNSDRFLLPLSPKSDAQKQVLATANVAAGQIAQTRILMMLQLAGGISGRWWRSSSAGRCSCFAATAWFRRSNATVLPRSPSGAIAVASAIFLIIELSQPYSGLFRIPRSVARDDRRARLIKQYYNVCCPGDGVDRATLNGAQAPEIIRPRR